MLPVVLLMAAGTNAHSRGRRDTSDKITVRYDGSFPGGVAARRSIFADPRFQQGIEQNILRRYKHMEKLINFYDKTNDNITKYWTYGCWCFQMGDYPLRKGNGSPVDSVDSTCKKHKECYQCARNDGSKSGSTQPGECVPEETGYSFSAVIDPVTGQGNVECNNKVGSCKRNICECDKAFASRLPAAAASSDGWNGSHHAHYGGFNSKNSCLQRIHTPGGGHHVVQCCGSYPDRYPHRFNKDGSGSQCCGGKSVFSTDTHTCCDDNVVTHGSC